jgi:ATP-dependent Lon protease
LAPIEEDAFVESITKDAAGIQVGFLLRRLQKEAERRKKEEAEKATETPEQTSAFEPPVVPLHRLVVARLEQRGNKSSTSPCRWSRCCRRYAMRCCSNFRMQPKWLISRSPISSDAQRPVSGRFCWSAILAGCKSRFARRLGEVLGLTWRTDASRSDGAVFGGTDRRRYSAEASHPFLAIAQGRIGNPLVLIDELDKAATRSDYGRLWDCLLPFLEPETSARYPDPALQTTSTFHTSRTSRPLTVSTAARPVSRYRVPQANRRPYRCAPARGPCRSRQRAGVWIRLSPLDNQERAAVSLN